VAGIGYSLITSGMPALETGLWHPGLNSSALEWSALGSAFVLLVLPQIPLTFGNAVVAVVDLEHRYFPVEARKVTARAISLSSGTANIVAGALTGMPMCHGSGGLTAHYRAGARTYRMNLMIGGTLLVLGLFFGPAALGLLALIPVSVLAGFLASTGLFHSSLASSLRGRDLAIAVAMGVVGVVTTNLALSLGLGLALYWPLVWAAGRNDGLEPAQS
jgi:sulfate permease, SulP family